MDRDTIIRLAREAGLKKEDYWVWHIDPLERFAALVAAHEREAMVAEAAKQDWAMRNEDSFEDAVREIAAAIRSRT